MRRDELQQPLKRRTFLQRLWSKRPGLLSCAYAFTLMAMGGGGYWAMKQPNPFAGEPFVTVSVPEAQVAEPPETETVAEADSASEPDQEIAGVEPAPETSADAMADEITTASTESAEEPNFEPEPPRERDEQVVNIITNSNRPLAPAPFNSVLEKTSWGGLPKVSEDGTRPSQAYARPTPSQVLLSDQPKIALLLGGMGLNPKLTDKAIRQLPGEITFGFAPYGEGLQAQVNAARRRGHEIFLQVPLEPVGFPATNPGPKTLLGESTEAENIDALRWHMGRFAGYAGVVNYMGNRFLAMPKAMKPVLSELKSRGILFLEDGSMAHSATELVAKQTKTQVKRARLVIDATPSREAIIAALTRLEEEATGTGFAIGTGTGLDITIEVVKEWAKAAQDRGIVLVPMTAAFKGSNS